MRISSAIPVLSIILLLSCLKSSGATRTALSSGKWEQASRWSGGQLPACGDSVIINQGTTVEITTVLEFVNCNVPIHVVIRGVLTFQTGKKLKLPCGSTVKLEQGAQITAATGGGNSNLIDICDITVWNAAQGNLNGPVLLQVTPLPINLAYFSVRPFSDGISISWITVSELNNEFFTVEKSKDGIKFSELTTVDGAGTSSQLNSYTVTDYNPYEGVQYFMLRQTDYDGKSTITKTIGVNWNSDVVFHIYPNPTFGELFANLDPTLSGQKGKLIINKADGKLLLLKDITVGNETYGIKLLHPKEQLKPGKYVVSLNFRDQNYTQMVISK